MPDDAVGERARLARGIPFRLLIKNAGAPWDRRHENQSGKAEVCHATDRRLPPPIRYGVYFAAEMRSFLTTATAAAFAIGFATTPRATVVAPADQKFEQIASLVTQKMAEYGVPGVAFGIVKNGQLTVRGLGVTNLDNPQPVTPDTVFALASISKTVTTTAMMRLVEQGKVDLSAP